MVKRAGFTFIELIFAIVIVSVVVMSLPKMSQLLSKNMDTNLVQEAIFAAATELHEATTKHWDENSIENTSSVYLAGVIHTTDNSCETNSTNPRYRLRSGHILQPYHRRCLNDLTQTEADSNTTAVDAVEDSIHTAQSIFLNPTPSQSGYKDNYTSDLVITYSPTFDGTARPNLKQITVTIKNSSGTTLTSLTSYVANIGEVDYYKRSY